MPLDPGRGTKAAQDEPAEWPPGEDLSPDEMNGPTVSRASATPYGSANWAAADSNWPCSPRAAWTRMGAFVTTAWADVPVMPTAICGTRSILCPAIVSRGTVPSTVPSTSSWTYPSSRPVPTGRQQSNSSTHRRHRFSATAANPTSMTAHLRAEHVGRPSRKVKASSGSVRS
jgi:hypothetical protein